MDKYYVYNKLNGKPKYIHTDFNDALEEAKRIATKECEKIEILKIVGEVECIKTLKVKVGEQIEF